MITNKIDVEVTAEKEAQVIQYIKDGRAQLDFLVGLSKKEIRRLAKLGSPYLDFTNRVRAHATKFPGYLPQQITLDMYNRDFRASESVHRILAEVKSFAKDLEDTLLVLKSEIYQTSRLYYKAVQASGRAGDKDADRIATDLSAHYMKKIPASIEPVEESGAANSGNTQG
jgi:hypothetical protein